MSDRVVILTGSHLCHNPRTYKEAESLSDAGFEVEVLGGWVSPELAKRDKKMSENSRWQFVPVVDWTREGGISRAEKTIQRSRRWIGGKAFHWLGWENHDQLGYCTRELLLAARNRKAAIYIAHSEPALWVANQLRKEGRRVGVDMEDWFSEDLLPADRKHRPLKMLRNLERDLLRSVTYSLCTSNSMSDALATEYQSVRPAVIYNAFPWGDRLTLDGLFKDRRNRAIPSIHWYSQTIGPGRGLEDLFAAAALIQTRAEIHIRGNLLKDFDHLLLEYLPNELRDRVFFHDLVSNDELLSRIAEHDIGFAGDRKYCRSRDLTVSNKVLQYLLGGLAVVASDSSGQLEIEARSGGAVTIYPSCDIPALASCLDSLLSNVNKLTAAKQAALRAAEHRFCWERNSGSMVSLLKQAIKSPIR